MHVVRELRSRHVVLSDGTRGGTALGRLAVVALVVAVALVLAWQWFPGVADPYVDTWSLQHDLPRVAVAAGLMVIACLAALLTWHAAGARTWRPSLAILGVVLVDVVVAMVLLEQPRVLRSFVVSAPSFAAMSETAADRMVFWGAVALVATVVSACAAWLTGRLARVVAAASAAVAPTVLAVVYLWPDSISLAGPATKHTQSGLLKAPVGRFDLGPALTISIAQLAGLVAVASFGVLAAFGIRELISQKAGTSNAVIVVGLPRRRATVVALALATLVCFVVGRLRLSPGERNEMIPALSKVSAESWILAALLGGAAIMALRSFERVALQRRGIIVPLAAAAALLTSGHLLLALSRVLQLLAGPFVETGALHQWLYSDLPSWTLWLQVWSVVIVPGLAAAFGALLVLRGERSDRSVFLVATAAISVVPGVLRMLDQYGIDAGLRTFSPATPDQVMIVVVWALGLAALVGRPLLSTARSVRLQLSVLLVTFVALLFTSAVGNRFFHLGLVVPLVVGLVFAGSGRLRTPTRGAHATVVTGGLLVLTAGGLMTGFSDRSLGVADTMAFLVLAAPLLVVELARVHTDPPPAEELVPTRPSPRRLPLLVVVAVAMMAVLAPTAATVDGVDGRVGAIDVALHEGWSGSQVFDLGAEFVELRRDAVEVNVTTDESGLLTCDAVLASGAMSEVTGDEIEILGMPVYRVETARGHTSCASETVGDRLRLVVVYHEQELTADDRAQLADIDFVG